MQAPWRKKCRKLLGKCPNLNHCLELNEIFRSLTHPKLIWDSFGISDLHVMPQSALFHWILYIFGESSCHFCVQYASDKWFALSLLLWCFHIHWRETFKRPPVRPFLCQHGRWDWPVTFERTFTFVGCDVCWIWFKLQRLLKLFKEALVGGKHLESLSLGPKCSRNGLMLLISNWISGFQCFCCIFNIWVDSLVQIMYNSNGSFCFKT